MNQREGRQGGTKGSWKRWREEGRNREREREKEREREREGRKAASSDIVSFLSFWLCVPGCLSCWLSLSPFPSLCPSEWLCQASRVAGKNKAHCGLQTPCRLATSCWPLTADLCTLVVCWGLWIEQEYVFVCVCVCVCLTVMSASQSCRLLTLHWHVPLHPSLLSPRQHLRSLPASPTVLHSSSSPPPPFSTICLYFSLHTFLPLLDVTWERVFKFNFVHLRKLCVCVAQRSSKNRQSLHLNPL